MLEALNTLANWKKYIVQRQPCWF